MTADYNSPIMAAHDSVASSQHDDTRNLLSASTSGLRGALTPPEDASQNSHRHSPARTTSNTGDDILPLSNGGDQTNTGGPSASQEQLMWKATKSEHDDAWNKSYVLSFGVCASSLLS